MNNIPDNFRALRVLEEGGKFRREIQTLPIDSLPPGEVLIRVHWSSLNYKDALSASGHKGVTRKFPHTPGIDAAGIVARSEAPGFREGDEVIVTGFELGASVAGGLGEFIRVPASWVVRRPSSLSLRDSMVYGTAGFTAAESILRMEQNGLAPGQGEVLVTGASGGVGSIAVAILAKKGYRVVAGSGKPAAADLLKKLGAVQILSREEIAGPAEKPMLTERWAGVVDTTGGAILATAIKSTRANGSVAACGLVLSHDLPLTVYPFILRGVNLLGIDSVHVAMPLREKIWSLLAGEWRPALLESLVTECTLEGVEQKVQQLLKGEVAGRTVVRMAR